LRGQARQNRAVIRRFVLVLAACAPLAACGSRGDAGGGATCDAAGARFLTVARARLAARQDADPTLRQGVDGLLAPMRDGMVKACREAKWSAPARDCFAGAADQDAIKACYDLLSPAQQEALATAAAGTGAAR
jgi:hypothetical protein